MVLGGTADEGKAELRKIETGPAAGNQVVIVKGVEAGERLIVKGHRSIVNGTSVRVVNEEKMDPAPAKKAPEAAEPKGETGTTDDKTKLADKQKN